MTTENPQSTATPESRESRSRTLRELDAPATTRAMDWLWTYMGALYGTSTWLAHAPLESKPVWADILGSRTGVDMKRGLDACRNAGDKYPPGAAAFNRRCAAVQPGTFSGGQPRELPSVGKLLTGATVSGSARAYLDMINRLTAGERLTMQELSGLPPCYIPGGDMIRPVDFCTAIEDEHLRLEHQS